MEKKESPFASGDDASNDAEEGLTTIGHTEELRRDFSIWSLGSLCLCLMGTVRTSTLCLLLKVFIEEG